MADGRVSDAVGWVVKYDATPPERDLVLAAEADAEWAVDDEESHWLRFRSLDQEGFTRLSREAFRLDESERLFASQDKVPFGSLPQLEWRRLRANIESRLPVAGYPEQIAHEQSRIEKLALCLVSAHQSTRRSPLPVTAMTVSLRELLAWVEGASAKRLARLRWAMRDSTALVMGETLPPVAGDYFFQVDRLLIPAGMWWSPELPAAAVIRLMDGQVERPEILHVWHRDQTVQHVDEESFATLSRAALRAAVNESS